MAQEKIKVTIIQKMTYHVSKEVEVTSEELEELFYGNPYCDDMRSQVSDKEPDDSDYAVYDEEGCTIIGFDD